MTEKVEIERGEEWGGRIRSTATLRCIINFCGSDLVKIRPGYRLLDRGTTVGGGGGGGVYLKTKKYGH